MACVVSVMMMVDVPVKANNPMTKEPAKVHGSASQPMSHVELRIAMLMLREEHLEYTPNDIVSPLAGLEDAGPVAGATTASLASANQNWPVQTLKEMLYKHLTRSTARRTRSSRGARPWA